MIAHVNVNGDQYEVKLTDDTTGEVIEKLNLQGQTYEDWKQTAEDSGTTVVEYNNAPAVQESTPGEASAQSAQSSPLPSIPENKEDPTQIEEYKSSLSEAKRLYAGVTGVPPSTDLGQQDLDISPNIIMEDNKDGEGGIDETDEERSNRTDTARREQKTTESGKSSQDKTSLSDEDKELSQNAENSGLLNSALLEPVPEFKRCEGDYVYNGKNNQWIVLGRDRPGGYNTGYGPGEGDTQAGAIDIVVGRMSPHPRVKNRGGSKVRVSPIFNYALHEGNQVCDASRIYISQKTDIDQNFKLANGRVGSSIARAGIALKSDAVRIIARDSGIKLITQSRQLMNSQGGKSSKAPSGIDIIAGNDDANLQPMVLGNNLVEVLREYGETINQVVGTVTSIIENIAKLDVALATHFHPQAFPAGVPNIPSPSLAPVAVESITKLISLDTFSAYAEKFKLEKIEKQYLSAGALQSIRSSFNNVN